MKGRRVGFDWDGTFEWDETKRRSNLAKHLVDLGLAGEVFADPDRVTEQADVPGEERFKTVAAVGGRVFAVIWTPRGRRVRVISLRRASDAERRAYRDV